MFRNHHVSKGWAVFSINLAHLEPKKVNPDEDQLAFSTTKGSGVTQRFRLPISPCKWAWDWAEYLGIRPPLNLGEWADAVELGSNPETTRYSARHGSIAYRGVVPPTAIRLERTDVVPELRVTTPAAGCPLTVNAIMAA